MIFFEGIAFTSWRSKKKIACNFAIVQKQFKQGLQAIGPNCDEFSCRRV